MGLNTRMDGVADATYSAPSVTYSTPTTSAAAIAVTFTTNTPTATTAQTIADGSAPTVVESGEMFANIEQAITNLVADVAALKTAIGQNNTDILATNAALALSAADSAAMLALLNDGE